MSLSTPVPPIRKKDVQKKTTTIAEEINQEVQVQQICFVLKPPTTVPFCSIVVEDERCRARPIFFNRF